MASNNPFEDEKRKAVVQQLGVSPNGANGLPEKDMFGRAWPGSAPQAPAAPAPTSNTMPIGGATAARGWNNINLTAPTQRNVNRFEGFNDERALAGTDTDSTKDGLRRWLGGLDYDLRGKSKDQHGEFFKGQMANAKEYGLDILDVQGDNILLNTKERGPEWIDMIRNAGGGDDQAFVYQSEFDDQADSSGGLGQSPAQMAQTGMQSLIDPTAGGNDALADVMAELQALVRGGDSPAQRSAVLSMLGGV